MYFFYQPLDATNSFADVSQMPLMPLILCQQAVRLLFQFISLVSLQLENYVSLFMPSA